MEPGFHALSELFAQLGLPSDAGSIDGFIAEHAPLGDSVRLEDAPCWTPAQATLLREQLLQDADWVAAVDRLNSALRRR